MKRYEYKRLYLVQPGDFGSHFEADRLGWFDSDSKEKVADNKMEGLGFMGNSGWYLCHKSDREMILVRELDAVS